jgi:hypothetical protein
MSKSESFRQGLKEISRIDPESGPAFIEELKRVSPDFADYFVEFAFGSVYSRTVFAPKLKELIAIATLAAMSDSHSHLKLHRGNFLLVRCLSRGEHSAGSSVHYQSRRLPQRHEHLGVRNPTERAAVSQFLAQEPGVRFIRFSIRGRRSPREWRLAISIRNLIQKKRAQAWAVRRKLRIG